MRERHAGEAAEDRLEAFGEQHVAVAEEVGEEHVGLRGDAVERAHERIARAGDARVVVRHVVETRDLLDVQPLADAAQEARRLEGQAPVVDDVGDLLLDERSAQRRRARVRHHARVRDDERHLVREALAEQVVFHREREDGDAPAAADPFVRELGGDALDAADGPGAHEVEDALFVCHDVDYSIISRRYGIIRGV